MAIDRQQVTLEVEREEREREKVSANVTGGGRRGTTMRDIEGEEYAPID